MKDAELAKLRINKSAAVPARGGRHRRGFRLVLLVVVLLILAVFLWVALRPAFEVRLTTVSIVFPFQKFTVLNASGYVVAQRKAAVAAKVTGQLEWLGVKEGDRVKQGQIIARLDAKDVTAARQRAEANLLSSTFNLDQARAELQDAKLQHDRYKILLDRNAIARTQFDSVQNRYVRAGAAVSGAESAIKAAQAALREAQVAVDYTVLRAPFDAVVLTKNADVGDIVTPIGAAANAKAAVVTIADMDSLQVEADVAESNLREIGTGQPCQIHLDAVPELNFRGKVTTIVPTADRTKATVMTKVSFLEKNERILPEMSAMVSFLSRKPESGEEQPRTAVNASSIVSRSNRKVAFQIKNGKAVMKPVVTGERIGDMVEIRSGLEPGDKIIENPPQNLRDGSKIKVIEV